MNISHLKYIVEVEKAGSISKAAENLYMGQPNLSKAIKELEQTLNIAIFRRTSKGTELTHKGREFLGYAKNILKQYEEMEALGSEQEQFRQELRISVPRASYVVSSFTDFILTLDMDKPLHADFFETNALRAIRNVADGLSDFGIIRCREEYQEYFHSMLKGYSLDWRDILHFSYQLIMQQNHPLATLDLIPYAALQPYIEIIHGDTNMQHTSSERVETERGHTPGDKKIYVYERGSQFDLLSRVSQTYMWVSPMPQDLLDRNGLVQRSCEDSPAFKDILIFSHRHRFTSLEKKFLAQVERMAKIITAGHAE
jgi:Transcriptional regulator